MNTRAAKAIKLYCSVNEVSQKSLAKHWGCSESTVTRFLAGKEIPVAYTMVKVFKWLLEEERV